MRFASAFTIAVGLLAGFVTPPASAQPARIIVLRHAEKLNPSALCEMGAQRAQALAKQYLGRDAQPSLFAPSERPAAMLAITQHTIETISPRRRAGICPSSLIPSRLTLTKTRPPRRPRTTCSPRGR